MGFDRRGKAAHLRVVHHDQRRHITEMKLREVVLAIRRGNRVLSSHRHVRCCRAANIVCQHVCPDTSHLQLARLAELDFCSSACTDVSLTLPQTTREVSQTVFTREASNTPCAKASASTGSAIRTLSATALKWSSGSRAMIRRCDCLAGANLREPICADGKRLRFGDGNAVSAVGSIEKEAVSASGNCINKCTRRTVVTRICRS